MRAMKDSGVEWIGSIPENWSLCRLKNYATILNGQDYAGVAADDGKYPVMGSGGQFATANTYLYDKESVLLGRKGTIDKPLYQDEPFWTVDTMYYTAIKDTAIAKFFYYLCTQIRFDYYQFGSAVPSMTQRDLNSVDFPLLDVKEQSRIASFLDAKCAQIDAIIEKQQQVIEKLKAYKLSVITEAVTKGLDPTVPMKDSGVEWIGMVPEKWDIQALKFILSERNQNNSPIITEERLSLSIDKGVTLYAEKTTNLDRFKDDVSKYKIAHPDDIVINSMNVIVGAEGISKYLGCVSPAYYVMYASNPDLFSIKYYDYAFKTSTIRKVLFSLGKGILAIERGNDRVNTCRLKVSRYDLGRLAFPVPQISEQTKIAEYLDRVCASTDAAICKKQVLIDKLIDYKKSLIYEAVTGKMEV